MLRLTDPTIDELIEALQETRKVYGNLPVTGTHEPTWIDLHVLDSHNCTSHLPKDAKKIFIEIS